MNTEAHNLLTSIAPLWLEPTTGYRIVAKSRRTYRSKRARRQAFYGNQKVARRMIGFMREIWRQNREAVDDAYLASLTSGIGWVQVGHQFDRGDGRGFPDEPPLDGEWPLAMPRIRVVQP